MLDLLLIEDEAPAMQRLDRLVAEIAPEARVVGRVDSIRHARAWLAANPLPQLILADIQLGDGLSLELFRGPSLSCPVIFVTAHDDYLLEAFAAHGIAYLLKPVKAADLTQAFAKYRELGRHYAGRITAFMAESLSPVKYRERLIAQRNGQAHPVDAAQVAFFWSENKLTFLLTKRNERLLVDESLAELSTSLDPRAFFRVNRNYLVRVDAIQSFCAAGKGRIDLCLQPAPSALIQVSQERAATFRTWIAGK